MPTLGQLGTGLGPHSSRAVTPPDPSTPRGASTPWVTPARFAVFLLILLGASFPAVLSGSKSFWYSDFSAMALPVAQHLQSSFWQGEWPLWNPLSNCGAPFLAQWGTLACYPFSLLFAVAPLPWSLNLFALGHIFLGGMGMFCLLRRWTAHPGSAAVAGVAYAFNGVSLSCLVWPNYTVALGWLPWLVLTARPAWLEGGRRLIAPVVIGGLQMLTGAPELILLTWVVLGVTLLSDLTSRPPVPHVGTRPALAGRFVMLVVLTAAVAAVQLLPFAELLAQSHRMGDFKPTRWAIPAWGWANLLVPTFRSGPPSDEIPQMQLGQGFLNSYYLGLGPMFLACIAVLWTRDRLLRGLGCLTLFCWWMAMGENSLLHPWVASVVPALHKMQYPVKFTLLPAFLIPFLAAHGWAMVDRWLDSGWFRWRRLLIPYAGLALLVAAVAWWGTPGGEWAWSNGLARLGCLGLFGLCFWGCIYRPGPTSGVALILACGVIAFDGTTHNQTLAPQMNAGAFSPGAWPAANGVPRPVPGEERVFIPPAVEKVMSTVRLSGAENRVVTRHLALWSHLNLADGIAKVNGSSTLPIRLQRDLEREIYKFGNTNCTGLLDFLGVAWVNLPEDPTRWIRRPTARGWLQVGAAARFDTESNLVERVLSPSFTPGEEVWFPDSARATTPWTSRVNGRITASSFRSDRITASADMAAPGLLTIAQSYSPYWKAWVNGKPVPLVRANHAFQAVPLPAGLSRVELRYIDPGFRLGLGITLTTLTGLGLWAAAAGRPGQRAKEQDRERGEAEATPQRLAA